MLGLVLGLAIGGAVSTGGEIIVGSYSSLLPALNANCVAFSSTLVLQGMLAGRHTTGSGLIIPLNTSECLVAQDVDVTRLVFLLLIIRPDPIRTSCLVDHLLGWTIQLP